MRRSFIIFVGLIMLSLSIGGCIDYEKKENSLKVPDGLYVYSLKLDTKREENDFMLYAPVPVLKNGTIFEAMNNIQVLRGNITIQFIDTIHGKAICIYGRGDFEIKATLRGCTYVELSMRVNNYTSKDPNNREYWLYYNSSKFEIAIIKLISESNNWVSDGHGHKIKDGDSFCILIEGSLRNGWQKINATYKSTVVD